MEERKAIDVNGINVALCEALGFEPNDIRSITIKMRAGHYPTLEVEMSLRYLNDHPGFMDAISKYELMGVMEPA